MPRVSHCKFVFLVFSQLEVRVSSSAVSPTIGRHTQAGRIYRVRQRPRNNQSKIETYWADGQQRLKSGHAAHSQPPEAVISAFDDTVSVDPLPEEENLQDFDVNMGKNGLAAEERSRCISLLPQRDSLKVARKLGGSRLERLSTAK